MFRKLSFYLSLVLLKDNETGEYTAFFAQFPDASAQGRNEEEAKKLLFEIFPSMLEDKRDEFLRYHPQSSNQVRNIYEQKVSA